MDQIFQLIERGDEAKVWKLVEESAQGSKNILSKRASIPKSPLTGAPVRLKSTRQTKEWQTSTELSLYGATPLLWAAAFGRTAMVELFLAHGAEVDESDKLKRTALIWASNLGFLDVVQSLIKHGANIEAEDIKFGSTALIFAASNLYTDVIKALVAAGAVVDNPNSWQRSALRVVLKTYEESPDRLEITEVLLSAGANVSDAEFLFSEEMLVNNFSTVILCLHHGATVNEEFLEMARELVGEAKETQLREILKEKVRMLHLLAFLD